MMFKKCWRNRGRRRGVQHRLMNYGPRHKLPPLPMILLSNIKSICNKMDELKAYVKCKRDFRETCMLAFTEMWLGEVDWDEDLHISAFYQPIRMARSPRITNKNTGGGVCFCINERYCNALVVWEKIYTPDLELLSILLPPSACQGNSPSSPSPLFMFSLSADRGGDQQTGLSFSQSSEIHFRWFLSLQATEDIENIWAICYLCYNSEELYYRHVLWYSVGHF